MSAILQFESIHTIPVERILDIYSHRVIAYRPELAELAGSAVAGLLLSQFLYWSFKISESDNMRSRVFVGKKYKNETGWFYKSAAEIYEETKITESEQKTARKMLVKKYYLFEDQLEKGLNRSVFYKLNMTKIAQDLINLNNK